MPLDYVNGAFNVPLASTCRRVYALPKWTCEFQMMRYFISVVVVLMMLVLSGTMHGAPRISKTEMEALAQRGELLTARVEVQRSSDLRRIADCGIVLYTNEPTYVIVAGDRARIDAVKKLGLSVQ